LPIHGFVEDLVAFAAAETDLLGGRRRADHEGDGAEEAVLGLGADHGVFAVVAAGAGTGRTTHAENILWAGRSRFRDRRAPPRAPAGRPTGGSSRSPFVTCRAIECDLRTA